MHRVFALLLCTLVLASSALAQDCDGWSAIGDPGPRVQHAMCYDSDRHVVVLFGGAADANSPFGGSAMGDTWEFDGARWRFRSLAGPPPRAKHALAYDSDRHVTVL